MNDSIISWVIFLIAVIFIISELVSVFLANKKIEKSKDDNINKVLREIEAWCQGDNNIHFISAIQEKGILKDVYIEMIEKKKYEELHILIELYYAENIKDVKEVLKENILVETKYLSEIT